MLLILWSMFHGGHAPADAYTGRAGAAATLRCGLQLAGVPFLAASLLLSAAGPPWLCCGAPSAAASLRLISGRVAQRGLDCCLCFWGCSLRSTSWLVPMAEMLSKDALI